MSELPPSNLATEQHGSLNPNLTKKGIIMVNYIKGTKEDMQELIDFANMVFSMSSGSIDFEKLLPKAYSEDRNMLATHHLIKEDGHIKALIDVFPTNLKMGKENLKTGYIGTVSVHPKARGKKYMIMLMEEVENQAIEDGIDMLILDGKRHRYQYYGFEKAGMKYCFNITEDSVRHGCHSLSYEEKDYQFVLLEETDEKWIDAAYALYQNKTVITRTREDFFLSLSSWEADTYAVVEGEECIGYLNVAANERNIYEVEVTDIAELPFIIKAFMNEIGSDELGIHAAMDEPQKIDVLDVIADYYTVNTSHQIKILHYENVLRFMLKWKLAVHKNMLQEGKYVIGVYSKKSSTQKNYLLSYLSGEVEVLKTELEADVIIEEKELVKTITTSFYYHAIQKPNTLLQKAPQGWFPLPFFLPEADAF